MYHSLIMMFFIINLIKGDCLYPEWKTTCQKYCMDNQLYEIQLNQCYSQNPDQLTCKCSGQILTNKIKDIIENKNSIRPSTSTVYSTTSSNEICIPSQSCIIGKGVCYNKTSYCTCHNGIWTEVACPEGNICKTQNTISSCQSTSAVNDSILLSSFTSTIEINKYLYIFVYWILVQCAKDNKF
ncbi:hypothetical protein I4U23_009832 [Adineta vaga]|nr:hypothetical protein I4U23_009832 [Adineta vaga]